MNKRLVVGVIGHVDHGKTALVRALTGEDTDRLPEEKQRGISIALGFAHLQLDADKDVDFIDMPGHEHFVRTMISGATGIDAVLLVVAANEGIKPQTIEHIDIAALLGLRHAVVAITKIDLAAPAQAKQVADQAVRLLKKSGLDPLSPVMVSALEGKGIDDLQHAIKTLTTNQCPRATDGLTFLPIDRAFSIAGHGPVVTGTLRGARATTEDTLELLPQRKHVRVRAVQVHGERVDCALPGQRVALNLRDIEIADLKRGMALAAPDAMVTSEWLTIAVRTVESAPPLKNAMKLRALAGTDEFDVRLRLLDRDVLQPGESGFAQLHCSEPIAIPASEHVILRLPSPPRTVAGGKVIEPSTIRQRRNDSRILQRLEDLRTLPSAAMIAAEVQRQGSVGTNLQHLSRLSSLAKSRIMELLKTLPVVSTRSGLVVWKTDMDNLLARIQSLLAPHASGMSRKQLLATLTATSTEVLDEALVQLLASRTISERSSKFLLARPAEDLAQASREAEISSEIAETLRRAGLTPLNPSKIVTSAQAKRAVDHLLRERVVVRAIDRDKNKELLFHRDAIETAKRKLEPLLDQAPGLLVTEIAAALGISRKYCMPLLDHLDTIHFTRRVDSGGYAHEVSPDKKKRSPMRPLKNMCEIAVIGGGIAGLAAARHAARLGRLVTLFEGSGMYGGQIATTSEVDGLLVPGKLSGQDLAIHILEDARKVGVQIVESNIASIDLSKHLSITDQDQKGYRPDAIVVATGASLRKLGVPREEEFAGRGLSHCATCDGGFYRGQDVVVVGGGDSAVQEALVLAKTSKRVIIVCRSPLKAKRDYVDKLAARENVSFMWDSEVSEILGNDGMSGIRIRNVKDGKTSDIECPGLFPFIGVEPNSKFVPASLLDSTGHIKTSQGFATDDPRVFAVGAVRSGYGGHIVEAMGEGVGAAEAASQLLTHY